MIKLNRNKIYEFGYSKPTIKIRVIDKETNHILEEFTIHKCIKRKNKLYFYAFEGKGKLTFQNINYATKYWNIIKNTLNK